MIITCTDLAEQQEIHLINWSLDKSFAKNLKINKWTVKI